MYCLVFLLLLTVRNLRRVKKGTGMDYAKTFDHQCMKFNVTDYLVATWQEIKNNDGKITGLYALLFLLQINVY